MTTPHQPGRFIRFDSLELPDEQLERIEASAAEWTRSIEKIISEALDRHVLSKTDSPAAEGCPATKTKNRQKLS